MAETTWLDATAQADLVRRGEVSPKELAEAAIAAIEAVNLRLDAVIRTRFDEARLEADGALPDGPFRGVPILYKDLGCLVAGEVTAFGLGPLRDVAWPVTSYLAEQFRAAGFVSLGRTNVPELGTTVTTEPWSFPPARNPWDPGHSTGGSSGGSAAAVAAGLVPVAHGNDGGGSIRIPASECGLVGLKPSRARNSLAPSLGDMYGGLVCEHVLTRSVRDSAAVLDATAGPVAGDPYWAPPPRGASFLEATRRDPAALRIGLVTASPTGSAVDPVCVEAVEHAARLCASLGHAVDPVSLPMDADAFLGQFIDVWAAGNAWTLAGWERRVGRAATPEDLEPLTWALCEMGRSIDAARFLASVEGL